MKLKFVQIRCGICDWNEDFYKAFNRTNIIKAYNRFFNHCIEKHNMNKNGVFSEKFEHLNISFYITTNLGGNLNFTFHSKIQG